jgi:hypothetical protein
MPPAISAASSVVFARRRARLSPSRIERLCFAVFMAAMLVVMAVVEGWQVIAPALDIPASWSALVRLATAICGLLVAAGATVAFFRAPRE